MSDQIPPAERLLNLVIALVHTPGRMTKEQIRRTVAGYADAVSDDAFERMFERDKDTLRDLGIPVLTLTSAGHGDDIGYRIDQDAYALPPVELTSAELAALSLAAEFWQDRSVRTETSRALTKLRAVGEPGSDGGDLVAGLTPAVRAGGDSFGPLLDAVQARQRVRFVYRAANTGEVREREVEPWRLAARRGGWIVIGRDVDRGATRSFRLSRIEGRVRLIGDPGAFDEADPEAVRTALLTWEAGHQRTAVLAVRPERAEVLRARAEVLDVDAARALLTEESRAEGVGDLLATFAADHDLLGLPYRATWELAEEVLGYGDAVLALDPPDLRTEVVRQLRTAAALDGGGPGDDPAGGPTTQEVHGG